MSATRAYAVVVSIDPGIARAFAKEIAQGNAKIEAFQTAIEASNPTDAEKNQLAKITDLRKQLADVNNQTGLIRVTKPTELSAYVETQYRPAVLALQ